MDSEEVIRIAARGDGVTASGRHIAGAVTGDRVDQAGNIVFGPRHAVPLCQHFEACGGCQLQHADDVALAEFVMDRVLRAAKGQDIEAQRVLPTHLSPPRSRRRVKLHAQNRGGKFKLGFRQVRSHRIVNLQECLVLHPDLAVLIDPLRAMVGTQKGKRVAVDVELALVDQGVDCLLSNFRMEGLAATEAALDFARQHQLARLSIDLGYGAETIWEPEPATVTFAGIPVSYPATAFLQATGDAQDVLSGDLRDWLSGCKSVADLFSGLGTFTFALATATSRVLAVEAARDTSLACGQAARRAGLPVEVNHRDLFRNPLRPEELTGFDGVVLDPPRAGAREQIAQLVRSDVPKIVYVSCNPSSWARDARQLIEAGYRLTLVRPVGQFRWSTHVELSSCFER